MTTPAETVSIPTADGDMPGLLWTPEDTGPGTRPAVDTGPGTRPAVDAGPATHAAEDAGPGTRPALVVFQEIFGVSDYIQGRCADLAQLGYVVLAPELYWRLPQQRVDEGAEDLLDQGLALVSQLDWDAAVRDGVSAVQHLAALPRVGHVGLVGFCLGGGLAYAVAASCPERPAALVSYYGSALPQLVEAGVEVDVPSVHHFGTADAYIPPEKVEEIRAWVTRGDRDVTFELYEGAGHAFDNPHPLFAHPAAASAAWARTVRFLSARLPAG